MQAKRIDAWPNGVAEVKFYVLERPLRVILHGLPMPEGALVKILVKLRQFRRAFSLHADIPTTNAASPIQNGASGTTDGGIATTNGDESIENGRIVMQNGGASIHIG